MRQQSEDVVSRVTQLVEIAAAVGVLAAVAIPAVLFPALQTTAKPDGNDSAQVADAGESNDWTPLAATSKRYVAPAPKDAPRVSGEFAIDTIRRLSDRFSFARQCAVAFPHVTDADVEELVRLAHMGEVDETSVRSELFVLWNWLVHLEAIDLTGTRITDKAMHDLAQLDELKEINLAETAVTDVGLAHLSGHKDLTVLILRETQVTDQGLQGLREFKQLEILDLWDTTVGDEGISALEGHSRLVSLSLGSTRVTNASLTTIGKLLSLQALDLENCDIDDQGIARLENLLDLEWLSLCNTPVGDDTAQRCTAFDQLFELNLVGTKITPNAYGRLSAALPECDISYQAAAGFSPTPSSESPGWPLAPCCTAAE